MHATIRATLIPGIVNRIAQEYGWLQEEALDKFYNSVIGANFADDETGLYGQSELYIYGEFVSEMKTK